MLMRICTYSPFFPLHLSSLTSLFPPSLSLRASRECQNKERLLEQRFRAALRDFQQWLVNAKISTAKCFDVPQSVAEASTALQRIQVRDFFLALIYSGHKLSIFLKHWWLEIVVMWNSYHGVLAVHIADIMWKSHFFPAQLTQFLFCLLLLEI